MRKKAKSKVFYSSFMENPFGDSGMGVPKIQMNPLSAIANNESKTYVQQILSGLSMLAVLIIVAIGGLKWTDEKQSVMVEANLNYKKSIQGHVTSVDKLKNRFTMTYQFSVDEDINNSGRSEWLISLPPGEFFASKRESMSSTCFTVPDLKSQTSQTKLAKCTDLVSIGKEVLVEYIILDVRKGEMVAKTILGQE